MDEGVVEKKNQYIHENLLKDLRLSEPSDFQNLNSIYAVPPDL
jgi:hypothetical protein